MAPPPSAAAASKPASTAPRRASLDSTAKFSSTAKGSELNDSKPDAASGSTTDENAAAGKIPAVAPGPAAATDGARRPSTIAAAAAAAAAERPAPPPPPEEPPAEYTVVFDVLKAANMLQYFHGFSALAITDEALPFVEDEDLAQAGITLGVHRRRLLDLFSKRVLLRSRGANNSLAPSGTLSNTVHTVSTDAPSTTAGSLPAADAKQPVEDEKGMKVGLGAGSGAAAVMTLKQGGTDILTPEMLETANAESLRKWKRGTLLGRGTYGSVYIGMLEETGRFYAVKVMGLNPADPQNPAAGMKPHELVNISREIAMMRRIKHDNICDFIGCCYDPKEQAVCLFMELLTGGSLTALVKKFKPLPPSVVRAWARQVVAGLNYLHTHHIMHRDIKGDNVLVDVNSRTPLDAQLKLADFGASKRLTEAVGMNGGRTVVGTPYWMAPEVVTSPDGYGYAADVWSVGCTVAEMITGKAPWPEKNSMPAAIMMIAQADKPTMLPTTEDGASENCLAFLNRVLIKDPDQRPTAAQLMNDPWIKGDIPA
jgi:hypothetical protein